MTDPRRTMKAKRRAPEVGYQTDSKAMYRDAVWRKFQRHARTSLKYCRVLLMPSIEGVEIDVAERFGCLRKNIIAVDNNVAIAATVSRNYPGITAWGCDVFAALERAAKRNIRLDVVHLDMTSNLSPSMLNSLRHATSFLAPGTVVCLNLLKGREIGDWVERCVGEWGESLEDLGRQRAIRNNPTPPRPGSHQWRPLKMERREELMAEVRTLTAESLGYVGNRRCFAVEAATGWTPVNGYNPETYISGKVPMQWLVWRVGFGGR